MASKARTFTKYTNTEKMKLFAATRSNIGENIDIRIKSSITICSQMSHVRRAIYTLCKYINGANGPRTMPVYCQFREFYQQMSFVARSIWQSIVIVAWKWSSHNAFSLSSCTQSVHNKFAYKII